MKPWLIFFAALALAALAADHYPQRAAVAPNVAQSLDLRSTAPASFYVSNGSVTATVVITPNGPANGGSQ